MLGTTTTTSIQTNGRRHMLIRLHTNSVYHSIYLILTVYVSSYTNNICLQGSQFQILQRGAHSRKSELMDRILIFSLFFG